ncbi:DUF5988 family protein [Streptomyces abikoensis]|uniref:DUF5988 family protein n=1 Tax=Streptomyces abikoensis TaxID=97398 RepID=UPI0033E54AE4
MLVSAATPARPAERISWCAAARAVEGNLLMPPASRKNDPSSPVPGCASAVGYAKGPAPPGRVVVLRGGPPEIPRLYRVPDGAAGISRVVVAFYGRHQRFEPTGETELVEGRPVPVFGFVYSTAIAE